MKFVRIPTYGLEPVIREAFKSDDELILKYHIAGGTLEECVQDTFSKIKEFTSMSTVQSYALILDSHTIGYTVLSKENELLYSFGINKSHRAPFALKRWFSLVVYMMPRFKCYLWNRNKRAIDFLVKCGMTINQVEQEFTILEYANIS